MPLTYLDREQSALYRCIETSLAEPSRMKLREEQKSWLRQRSSCYANGECIAAAYRSRILQLQNWC